MKKETLKDPVDGSIYVGEVKEDFQYHGQGTLTYPDGKIVKGQFKNGEFVK